MGTSPKLTGTSAITGKTVEIRHATLGDMVFIEENAKKFALDAGKPDPSEFVVAAEDGDIIGFGRLMKTGKNYEIGCIAVVEGKRRRGIGASIVKHLVDYAPVNMVYVVTDLAAYFRKLGFAEVKRGPKQVLEKLGRACELPGRRKTVLMAYRKQGD